MKLRRAGELVIIEHRAPAKGDGRLIVAYKQTRRFAERRGRYQRLLCRIGK